MIRKINLSLTSQPNMRVVHLSTFLCQLVLFDVKLRAHVPFFLTEAVFVTLRAEPAFVFYRALTSKSSSRKTKGSAGRAHFCLRRRRNCVKLSPLRLSWLEIVQKAAKFRNVSNFNLVAGCETRCNDVKSRSVNAIFLDFR